MNLHLNPYCAFNADGSRRLHGHSTKWFRQAWRRMVIIVQRRQALQDQRQAAAGWACRASCARRSAASPTSTAERTCPSPSIRRRSRSCGRRKRVARPRCAATSRAIFARREVRRLGRRRRLREVRQPHAVEQPEALLQALEQLAVRVGEYGPWDNDTNGAFTRRILNWAKRDKRVRALLYFRSNGPRQRLQPAVLPGRADRAARAADARAITPAYAPGVKKHRGGGGGGGIHP